MSLLLTNVGDFPPVSEPPPEPPEIVIITPDASCWGEAMAELEWTGEGTAEIVVNGMSQGVVPSGQQWFDVPLEPGVANEITVGDSAPVVINARPYPVGLSISNNGGSANITFDGTGATRFELYVDDVLVANLVGASGSHQVTGLTAGYHFVELRAFGSYDADDCYGRREGPILVEFTPNEGQT